MSSSRLSDRDEAIYLFDNVFPKDTNTLNKLIMAVRAHKDFPMKNGTEQSVLGKYFTLVPTYEEGNNLEHIIDMIIKNDSSERIAGSYTVEEINNMYKVFRDEMLKILTQKSSVAPMRVPVVTTNWMGNPKIVSGGAGGRRRRGTKRARRGRRRSSRKN